ncbi:MAG: insulinase family protein, partial [Candidatus Zixiibacteriota bacterium]
TSIGLLSGNASVNSLSDYQDMVLDILADILRNPVFDQDKIDLAKVQARSDIARRNDDPQGLGFREFRRLIYGANSVYGRQPEYATINAITRDDLVAFHKKWFHPEAIQMAIWGDFKTADIIKAIKKRFADWPRGNVTVPPPPKVNYTFEEHTYYIEKKDVTQSGIFMGHIGGLLTDPDYPTLIVMNNIMGGGLGNRMFNAVRSKEGLAYAASGRYSANIAYPGVFVNYVGTKSETTAKAVREAVKVIKSMQTDPPTPEEMKKGKESYLNSFVFNFDSKAKIVNRLMNFSFYGLPADFLNQVRDKVEKVTADDVVAAANKYLHPDKLKLLVVGKAEDFDEPLSNLGMGPVDTIDITIPSPEEKHELSITPDNLKKGHELLLKAIEAHGGAASFAKVKTISAAGTFTLSMQGRELPLSFTEYKELPDKFSRTIEAFGQKMVDIRNGDKGWKTDQRTMTVQPKTQDDLAKDDLEYARDNVAIFRNPDDPNRRAVFDGTGKVNGIPVNFVALVDKDGNQICRLGFNQKTNELVCKYYKDQTMLGEGTVEVVFSNFNEISGVKLPMTATQSLHGDKFGEMSYSSLKINEPIPAGTFEKPQ